MANRILLTVVTCAALLLGAVGAAAQEKATGADAAKASFEKGKRLFESGSYAEAANAFREANRLQPSWKLLYNIGQCEMMAKRHALALEAFERYLSEGGDDIGQQRTDEVLREVLRLRAMVGFADVKAPAGSVVIVDDVERGKAPLPGPVAVDAGVEHRVLATRGGATVLDRVVRVSGGQTVVVGADAAGPPEAAADDGAPSGDAPTEQVAEEPRVDPRAAWGWTATGVGAALLVAGAVTGGLALASNAKLRDGCDGGDCLPAWHDEVDKRDALATSTNVLLGAGAAVAVVGVLLLTVFRGDEEEAAVGVSRDGVVLGKEF